jgi:ApaG protein
MYRAVTRQIEVTVEPNFLPEKSSAENREFFWSYTVVITNSGKETVQLRTRHWVITDASGRRKEIRARCFRNCSVRVIPTRNVQRYS